MDRAGVDRTTQTKKVKRRRKFPFAKIFYILLIFALAGTAGYFYNEYRNVRDDPQKVQQKETEALIGKVSKLYNLPSGTPTIATVQDREKLKDQPFFKDAQNGDKLLMYTSAKQAIIYREKDNRIINVGPIAIADQQAAQKQQ